MTDIELKTRVVTNKMHSDILCNVELCSGSSATSSPAKSLDATTSLLQYCARNSTVFVFLRATANFWLDDMRICSADGLYYGLTRFVNVANIIVNTFGMTSTLLAPSGMSQTVQNASAGIDITTILRTVSVVIVQYINQCRIQKPAHAHEVFILEESARIAGTYGMVVLCTNFVSTILLSFSSVPVNAGIQVTEYFLGTYLSFNLFFLILDVKASSVLLDQLHLLADNRSLTMKVFVASRSDIHRRVKESRWACDLIVVPCIASVIGILVLIIYFLSTPVPSGLKIEAAAFVCILLKELLFVMVAFWYVAKVNARADELTIKLSRDLWELSEPLLSDKNIAEVTHNSEILESSDQSSINGQVRTPSNVDLECDIAHATDTHRLSIHASSISEPISFTLLFKRVSWRNVAISSGGFVLAIFIAVVKNAVEQSIEK